MRIVITGIGMVSPLALDAEGTWSALLAGARGFAPVSLFSLADCEVSLVAQVDSREPIAPQVGTKPWSRADAMAVRAAGEALGQAQLTTGAGVDLVVGGTTAGMFENEELLARVTRDPDRAQPDARFHTHPLSAPADRIHEALGPFARVRSLCSACSGGAAALVWGASQLAAGRSQRVLAGGVDALCRLTLAGFAALGALDPEPCRPFDRRRAGLNLGEGAAFLMLETERGARERGVAAIAQLSGWASASEAHHITHPEPSGVTAAWTMTRALARAGAAPQDVGYVSAHGTATPHNDSMEAQALKRCFGDAAARLPVSSIKGHIGHTLGAAGAIEAAVCALAVQRGRLVPTVGLEELDPECDGLDHVTTARVADVEVALSNSFGFGGNDVCLVMTRSGDAHSVRPAARVVFTGGGSIGPLGLRGSRSSFAYTEPGELEGDGLIDVEPLALDPMRARRMGRGARLVTAAIELALDEAVLEPDEESRVGVVVGSALGTPSGTGSFLVRVFERGARFASPAVFPFVLPSAVASCPSIYHRLRGPSFSVADLATTGECAIAMAAELIACGEARAMVAAVVEERSPVAERIAMPVLGHIDAHATRGEGAMALVLETAARAAARGAPLRAELTWMASWRGDDDGWRREVPPPRGRACVVLSRPTPLAIPEAWAGVEVTRLARLGSHEGAGGFAVLAAVAAIDEGLADSALVLGSAPDRGYAMVLAAPTARSETKRS